VPDNELRGDCAEEIQEGQPRGLALYWIYSLNLGERHGRCPKRAGSG